MDTARNFELNHLPLVDSVGCVTGLVLRSDMVADPGEMRNLALEPEFAATHSKT